MFCFECDHIPDKYPEILRIALENGTLIEPRGSKCFEISPMCITAFSPRKRLFGTPGRNENPIFPYVEGLWTLKGDDTPDMPSHYVRQTLCYVNQKTGRFDGAYGPRMRPVGRIDQFDAVYRRLLSDRESRRAVMTIFDPRLDNNENSLDIPCTISMQFLIRNDFLNMITYMRSNDLFRGFIYDTVEFQWFQEILAGWLGVEVGKYTHLVGSAHVYLNDKARIEDVVSRARSSTDSFSLYKAYEPQDARLPKTDFDRELQQLFAIEESSRYDMLCKEKEEIEGSFQSRFYRNLALAIAGYNAHNLGHGELSAELFSLIDNELGSLMRQKYQNLADADLPIAPVPRRVPTRWH